MPYAAAAAGSVAVDMLEAQRYYRLGRFPSRYRRFGYYALRAGFAALASFLALLTGATNPIHAFSIGVAAPLVIEKLTEHVPKLDS